MKIRITGLAHRLGSTIIAAESLENHFKRDPGTVTNLSGVTKLHRMGPGENLVTLARDAARDAIKNAGVELSQVSGIFSSCNPTTDYLMPTLQARTCLISSFAATIGARVGMGCAGGVQALQVCFNQLLADSARGKIRTYVIVTGDHISRMLDPESWKTAILFSDGISAIVVTNNPEATGGFVIEQVASECYAGEEVAVINLPNPLAAREAGSTGPCLLQMRGRGVFEFGTRIAPRVKELIGITNFEEFYVIPHQANIRMINELIPTFDIKPEQLYVDGITKIGNISGAACFLGLEDIMDRPLANNYDKILLCAFGAFFRASAIMLADRSMPVAS